MNQTLHDAEKIRKIQSLLSAAGVFYLATVDDHEPRVRPFGFNMLFEDKLYFGVGTHKLAYKQLEANPNVELCSFSKGNILRVKGKAVFDHRQSVQEYMYEASPSLKARYNDENGMVHACFYLEDMTAEVYNLGGYYEKLL